MFKVTLEWPTGDTQEYAENILPKGIKKQGTRPEYARITGKFPHEYIGRIRQVLHPYHATINVNGEVVYDRHIC